MRACFLIMRPFQEELNRGDNSSRDIEQQRPRLQENGGNPAYMNPAYGEYSAFSDVQQQPLGAYPNGYSQ